VKVKNNTTFAESRDVKVKNNTVFAESRDVKVKAKRDICRKS